MWATYFNVFRQMPLDGFSYAFMVVFTNKLRNFVMDMSKAALPPRSGNYTKQDEQHPLFPLYRQYLNSRARLMIDAADFDNWLYQYNSERDRDEAAQHPQYAAFLAWMRETKAGGRKCCATRNFPEGLSFPHNFAYWLEGGRW